MRDVKHALKEHMLPQRPQICCRPNIGSTISKGKRVNETCNPLTNREAQVPMETGVLLLRKLGAEPRTPTYFTTATGKTLVFCSLNYN